MIQATEVRKGMVLQMDGDLLQVLEYQHVTPGNWRGMVQLKLRSLIKGTSTQKRLRTDEKVDQVTMDEKEMEFLYDEGPNKVFMDRESFEQIPISPDILGDAAKFIAPGLPIHIQFHEGRPILVDLPPAMVLKVKETAQGIRGDSANNVYKPATLETGAEISVPLFINEGDSIKVDTRTGKYMERA